MSNDLVPFAVCSRQIWDIISHHLIDWEFTGRSDHMTGSSISASLPIGKAGEVRPDQMLTLTLARTTRCISVPCDAFDEVIVGLPTLSQWEKFTERLDGLDLTARMIDSAYTTRRVIIEGNKKISPCSFAHSLLSSSLRKGWKSEDRPRKHRTRDDLRGFKRTGHFCQWSVSLASTRPSRRRSSALSGDSHFVSGLAGIQ